MERGGLEVGDVVYTSWGYDQTQVEFYRVVALTPSGKSVRVVQVGAYDMATGDNMHRSLVPIAQPVCGPKGETLAPQTVLILDDRGTVKVHGHHAWKWDGKPKYATGHGYGH